MSPSTSKNRDNQCTVVGFTSFPAGGLTPYKATVESHLCAKDKSMKNKIKEYVLSRFRAQSFSLLKGILGSSIEKFPILIISVSRVDVGISFNLTNLLSLPN